MAEAMTLVCDVCGRPDAEPVTFRVNGKNLVKDFCPRHLSEVIEGARVPKRGRRPGAVSSNTRKSGRKAPTRKKPTARKRSAAKTTAKKR
jgi:hypothetical protein